MTAPKLQDGPPEGEGYDLQRIYEEQSGPFWFRWDDRWWKLPHFKMLDFMVQAQVESFDFSEIAGAEDQVKAAKAKVDELFALIMGVDQGEAWSKVEKRPTNMMLDMLREWTKHSGVQSGESPASTSSSGSTGRPSNQTSKPSTASGSAKRSAPRVRKTGTPPVNSSSASEG